MFSAGSGAGGCGWLGSGGRECTLPGGRDEPVGAGTGIVTRAHSRAARPCSPRSCPSLPSAALSRFHTLYVIVPTKLNPNFSSNALNWLANHHNDPVNPAKNLFTLDEENLVMAAVMAVAMQTVVTVTFHM